MTHFLSCGFLRDYLAEISNAAAGLRRLLDGEPKQEAEAGLVAKRISETAREALDLLDAMPCEPLVWTGPGNAEEVIGKLEKLLSAEEE